MSNKAKKIGIIGEGIMGLTIANILLERYPFAHLQITTNKRFIDTTSHGAVGYVCINLSQINDDRYYDWYKKSIDHYLSIFRSPESVLAGISVNNLYYLSDKKITADPIFSEIFHSFRYVDSKELNALGFSSHLPYAIGLLSTLVEPRYYLPYLQNIFIKNGGEIILEKVEGNVADWAIAHEYDIVINCSGLASAQLFNDNEILPMRGQIVRVDAPWFKHSFITTDDTYAFTCRESVALGTVRQLNDSDQSIRSENTDEILKRISEHNICLSESDIIEEWAGIRPWRNRLRLEMEFIKSSTGIMVPIVHNYGHGSSGIGLSWGTSLDVADLVDSILMKH